MRQYPAFTVCALTMELAFVVWLVYFVVEAARGQTPVWPFG